MRKFDFFDEGVRRVFENYELPVNENAWSNFQSARNVGTKNSSFARHFVLPGLIIGGLFAGFQNIGEKSDEHAHMAEEADTVAHVVQEKPVSVNQTLVLSETEEVSKTSSTEETVVSIKDQKGKTDTEYAHENTSVKSNKNPIKVLSEIDESILTRETVIYKGSDFKLGAPNKFTPNGDNLSDVFMPSELANEENFLLEITNNRGEIVFKSKDYAQKWNGFILDSEEKAKQGEYKWRVLVFSDTQQKMYEGSVKLFR